MILPLPFRRLSFFLLCFDICSTMLPKGLAQLYPNAAYHATQNCLCFYPEGFGNARNLLSGVDVYLKAIRAAYVSCSPSVFHFSSLPVFFQSSKLLLTKPTTKEFDSPIPQTPFFIYSFKPPSSHLERSRNSFTYTHTQLHAHAHTHFRPWLFICSILATPSKRVRSCQGQNRPSKQSHAW
jgi:hypothetical protein